MKRFQSRGLLAAALVMTMAMMATITGCASPPDRYYTLVPVGAATPATLRPAGAPLVVELLPLALPDRLARAQMVVRQSADTGSAEVAVLEQHRWASSFESELRDALASGVAARLGAVDASRSGGNIGRAPGQPAWRIAVQVRQFDAIEGTRVDAALSWSIRRSDQEASAGCQWAASEAAGAGIDGLAQGAQRVTARAVDAIARHVAALAAGGAGDCKA